jgi:hypothetical protein
MLKSDSAVVLRELGRRWERKSKQEKDTSNEKESKDKDKEKAEKPEKTGGDKWKAQHMDLAEKRDLNLTYLIRIGSFAFELLELLLSIPGGKHEHN